MSVIIDTSVALAVYDAGEPEHPAVARWLRGLDDDMVTTPMAVAEMDRLIAQRGGERGRKALWRDLDAGVYTVRWWADALAEALDIARRHPSAGLVDASLVALAGRLRTTQIATLDPHFRSLTTARGEPFVVLPADVPLTERT